MAANAPKIKVVALFSGKAMVKIDGKQVMMAAGDVKHGVKLVRASSREAVIEVNGQQKKLGLGSQVSTKLAKPKKHIVRIPSNRGMYLTQGLINGRNVDFLVDTGASVVAMSRVTADKLQIPYREKGIPSQVSTASELKDAWAVMLDTVTVGGIKLNRVQASIIDTNHDQQILLGMSFLSRLKMTQEQGIVVLEARTQ